jgi:AmiR/NasT family two-component response regulator
MSSTDRSPARDVTVGEISRLVAYADAQERKAAELAKTVSELQHALDTRVVIDRAIGMLAERFKLAIGDAWELLRSAARDNRREVRALATEITESRDRTPDEIVDAVRGGRD